MTGHASQTKQRFCLPTFIMQLLKKLKCIFILWLCRLEIGSLFYAHSQPTERVCLPSKGANLFLQEDDLFICTLSVCQASQSTIDEAQFTQRLNLLSHIAILLTFGHHIS